MIQVTEHPIETDALFERLCPEGTGSIVVHVGVVKPVVEERKTQGIRLIPDGDLKGELEKIEHDMREKWNVLDILLIRRIGELRVGETILVAGVTAASKEQAFGACQEAVGMLKKKRGLKKEELYES